MALVNSLFCLRNSVRMGSGDGLGLVIVGAVMTTGMVMSFGTGALSTVEGMAASAIVNWVKKVSMLRLVLSLTDGRISPARKKRQGCCGGGA